MTLEERTAIAERDLSRLLDWVSRVDNRISVVLGIDTAMAGVLASLAPPQHSWSLPVGALTLTTFLFIASSLLLLYAGAYPRTTGPGGSLVYFGAIANLGFDQYRTAVLDRTPEQYLDDLLAQCHRNAEIIQRKFGDLRGAYQMSFLAIPPWALSLYLFKTAS